MGPSHNFRQIFWQNILRNKFILITTPKVWRRMGGGRWKEAKGGCLAGAVCCVRLVMNALQLNEIFIGINTRAGENEEGWEVTGSFR